MKLYTVLDYQGRVIKRTSCPRAAKLALTGAVGGIDIKTLDLWDHRYWIGSVVVFFSTMVLASGLFGVL